MCIIVDTSVAPLVFSNPTPPDYTPIFDWIENKGGCLIYGGRLKTELFVMGKVARRIRGWSRAGRAMSVPDGDVDAVEKRLCNNGICRSDDPHVIALARISFARTLCADDRDLETDFKDPTIVPKPRGRIYRNAGHVHLLTHSAGCIGNPRRRT